MMRCTPPSRARRPSLESREVLSSMIGLTAGNELVGFDSTRPDLAGRPVAISGLQTGETILAIDARPSTGQVYGLGSTGRLYTIDPTSGASIQVGSGPIATPLSGADYDIDFNAATDTLRLVSNAGLDLRINPDTLDVTTDPNLAYAPTDAGAGTTPSVVAAAYASGGGPLYEIDSRRGVLVTQGNATSSPAFGENAGQLFTVNSPGLVFTGDVGMDILPGGTPIVSIAGGPGQRSALYRLFGDATGAPGLIGNFPSSLTIRDVASLPTPSTVYAVTGSNALISFRSTTPGTLLSSQAILGLQPGETIGAIAFRHSTGKLYGFGTSGRLYTINTTTAAASPVSSAAIAPAYDGTKPSIEFLSDTDRIQLVTKGGQDLRINPDTGAVDQVGAPLAYASGDPSSGTPPAVVAEATSGAAIGPTSSARLLFGIDSAHDTLVTLGSPGSGIVGTTGPLGLDVTDDAGLDTAPGDGPTLASLTPAGSTSSVLYQVYPRVNGSSSAASSPITTIRIGTIGGGAAVRDMAIAPSGTLQFSTASYAVDGSATAATIVVTRTGGTSGPLQVTYATSDGTAQSGVNYQATRGTLDFADGETSKSFTVTLLPNSFPQGSRTVNLMLTSDTPGVVGATSAAVLTITAAQAPTNSVGAIASATFHGTATAITSVDVALTGPIDPVRAANPANYVVQGITSDRSKRSVVIAVSSAFYDATTGVVRLTFANSQALKDFRTLQVAAKGIGVNGADSVVTYGVLRGAGVRYLDSDGDRVFLGVLGHRARLVVLRRSDGGAVSAWVEGSGKLVTGFLIPRRGSNRRAVIDHFATNGARLRLSSRITVASSSAVA